MILHTWRKRPTAAMLAAAVLGAAFSTSALHGAIIVPANDNYDVWVRESNPDTVYQGDAMWTSNSPSYDGGLARIGLVQFDLSGLTEPITTATFSLNYRTGVATTLAPSYWVNSSGWSSDLSTVNWNIYASDIQPDETQFEALGGGDFAGGQGLYHTTGFGSAADAAVLESIRQGDGIVTVVFKATAGGRDWTADDALSGFMPARLYLNEIPPENPDLQLDVNRFSGAVSIRNPATVTSFDFDGYTIESDSGTLVHDASHTMGVGWDSLTDQGLGGWQENAPSANAVSETNLLGSKGISPGETISLGLPYTSGSERDLAFTYSLSNGQVLPGAVNYIGGLELRVTTLLGDGGAVVGTRVQLVNPEAVGIDIDGYVIQSESGALNPAALDGLSDNLGGTWGEIALSANAITELNLLGSSVIGDDSLLNLGAIFTGGGAEDLVFTFNLAATGEQLEGLVTYLARLMGDANGDNMIDIFDVATISNQWGTAGPDGDVNGDGTVDIFDVAVVSNNWGNTLPGGAASVPEPATWSLAAIGAALGLVVARRRT